MTIRLASVVGGDTTLLGYAIPHYRALGVESFHIARQVEDSADPGLAASVAVMRDQGLDFSRICVSPWHEDLNARLIREAMASAPHDWWVIADLDEFHVYDRPLSEVIGYCEDNGCDYVSGAMLDRVAAGGELRDVESCGERSIWEQYPLAGLVTFRVLHAMPTKVTLACGTVELDYGQHRTWNGTPAPSDALYPQVHHFKWTATIRARLEQRVAAYSSAHWQTVEGAVIDESIRVLRHIDDNAGRIDISRPDFDFLPCGSRYTDYTTWASARTLWQEMYEDYDNWRISTRAL
jgi:hypothetical protein